MSLLNAIHWIREGLFRRIWDLDTGGLPLLYRGTLRLIQISIIVVRDFLEDRCLLRASALTYATLLAIVPLFALMFSVLKGLGVQNTLEPILLEKIAVGSEEVISAIIRYINNTHVGSLGTAGLVGLVFTVIALLTNIERTFNHVWGVRETRPLLRRFADYSSVVIIGPLFIFAAISMTTTLQSLEVVHKLLGVTYIGDLLLVLFKVLPFFVMWAAFVALYVFMPNIKVSFRAALVGGIFGGTLWQIAQWVYIDFQIGVARYNAIYGTMAALPIFMVWIYLSWMIVLLGLEVTYVWQNIRSIRLEIRGSTLNFASREIVALAILRETASQFMWGGTPSDQLSLSERLRLSPRVTRKIIDELVCLNFLSEVHGVGENGLAYQPAHPTEKTLIYDVIESLRMDGTEYTCPGGELHCDVLTGIELRIREASRAALDGMTLEEMVIQASKGETPS